MKTNAFISRIRRLFWWFYLAMLLLAALGTPLWITITLICAGAACLAAAFVVAVKGNDWHNAGYMVFLFFMLGACAYVAREGSLIGFSILK